LGFIQQYAAKGGPEFFFVINIQVSITSFWLLHPSLSKYKIDNHSIVMMNQMPGTPMYSLALYYMLKTPLEDNPLLQSFVDGDDAYRNSRFKLIPYISKVHFCLNVACNKQIKISGSRWVSNGFHSPRDHG